MKRTPLRRKTPLKRKRRTVGQKKKKKRSQSLSARRRGYRAPKWFTEIKYFSGDHGTNAAQKRLWRITSEYIRRHDAKKYGKCVSCDFRSDDWHDYHCGHFKKYSVCNSWFKFQHENLAAQCPGCNFRDDGPVGHAFGEELKRRYHKGIVDWIEATNLTFRGHKMETWEIVDKVAQMRPDLVH